MGVIRSKREHPDIQANETDKMTIHDIAGQHQPREDELELPTDAVVFSARSQTGPFAILRDLRDGFRHGPIWRVFAWDEIENRYRRSMLGVAWIGISYAFFVVVIVLFFRGFAAKGTNYYINHVAVGYAAFMFLMSNVTDGCHVFKASATWIKSASLPYSVYVFKGLARAFFPFVIHFGVAIIIMLIYGWRPSWSALLAAPALFVYLINAVWVQYLLGLIAARWQDVIHLIATITRLLFFATPIIWVYSETSGMRRVLADFNPFTHFVEIFRAPLIGDPIIDISWPIVLGCTAVGWIVTIIAGGYMRRRLPFWV